MDFHDRFEKFAEVISQIDLGDITYPVLEEMLRKADTRSEGATTRLIRMMNIWRQVCNVPIEPSEIELIAIIFISVSSEEWIRKYRLQLWDDKMVTHFFEYLTKCAGINLKIPDSNDSALVGDKWLSKAQAAYEIAARASKLESRYPAAAGLDWKLIFGDYIPEIIKEKGVAERLREKFRDFMFFLIYRRKPDE